ncbi:MAG: CotH kinase family protein, partial [Pirellulales bacterium]
RLVRVETLEVRQYLAADLVITEFMASNDGGLLDQDGNASDWIEIHNPSSQVVNLGDWSLTDTAARRDRWRFPAFDVDPGGYVVVFASGKDRANGDQQLHTNFKLRADGEYLALVSPDGSVVSEYGSGGTDFPPQLPNVAYGVPGESNPLLAAGTSFSYLVPTSDDAAIGTGWTELDFDDSTWTVTDQVGLAEGVGFSPTISHPFKSLVATDVKRAMLDVQSSIWLRQEFDVADPTGIAGLTLQMQYDDGFVVYLNGVKTAEVNAPEDLAWNSTATATRLQETTVEEFFIGTGTGHLRAGRNVLAIQGLNVSADDLDFLIRPQLVAALPMEFVGAPVGFLERPTPNRPNGLLRSATVTFDRASGLIDGPVTLQLAVDMQDATIHYSTDGSLPTEASPVYDARTPLVIDSTTRVRAIAVAPGHAVSTPASAWFTMVDADLQNFSSNLPVVTLDSFGSARPIDTRFQFNALAIYEPDAVTGRATLTRAPNLMTRAGIKVRGSSTAGRDKASFSVEAWNDRNEDKEIAPLGMPSNSDWILYAPFNFDRALMRNPLIYELSNQVGRYAVRTRFVELYQNRDGGNLSAEDYRGVYVLMEKLAIGPDRVDIVPLQAGDESEPEVSGGWLLKIDRPDPGDTGFRAAQQTILYVDPKEEDVTRQQADWIRDYFDQVYASLTDTDPETGYAQYIDVDSWIDHHILNVFPFNVDAFRLSGYFFKDRGGKLEMGPVWDFDRSMESTDGRDDRPDRWGTTAGVTFFEYVWWDKLFQDPAFKQRWIDRWFELRKTVLSEQNITATIERLATQLGEAQERNFARWRGGSAPRTTAGYPSGKLDGTWRGEVEHMKAWLMERLAWIDSQFPEAPDGTPTSGLYPDGQPIRLSVDEGTVYYTTDGSDPRLPNGEADPRATIFNPTTTVVAGDSAARFLIPRGAPTEAAWQTIGFDDSAWTAGTPDIGFDTGVSDARIDVPGGFTVRAVYADRQVGDFSTAEAVLAGTDILGETTVQGVPAINFLDGGPDGNFASSLAFPGGGGDDFVIDVTGTLQVNVEGTYTFGVNTDEGSKLWIDGRPVIQDPGTHPPRDRLGRITLAAGAHELRFVMFERAGGAEAELFVAAGDFRTFNDTFVLLGGEDQSFAPAIGTDVQSDLRGVNSSLYVRIPFAVEHAADTQRVTLGMQYDDGFVAYLNGVEVARRNAPERLAFDAAATDWRLDRNALREEAIDITDFKELLGESQNVLAIQGLNVSPDDADFLVVPRLRIQRFGESLLLDDSMAINARVWHAGQWSSPVEFPYVVAGSESDLSGVEITEVHFDPTEPTDAERASNSGLDGQDFEFIELVNQGDHTVDLAGSALVDGVTFTFADDPRSRLAPGEYLLVVRNEAAFRLRYGSGLPVVGQFTGRLNNRGERIVLVDRFGSAVQDFRYGVGDAWPDRTAGM